MIAPGGAPQATALGAPPGLDPSGGSPAPVGPTWATISTMKETPELVMNFIAHHLLLGASEIIIYFDDPDDPCIDLVSRIPRVRAVRGGVAFLASLGKSAQSLPSRQKYHARMAYKETKADWIIHIDADEFICSDRPVSEYLREATCSAIRLMPFEALATPKSGRGGRPENYYRGELPDTEKGARVARAAYAPFEHSLTGGLLSHAAGKFFARTGIANLKLSVHSPTLGARKVARNTNRGLFLLHFHGGDYAVWRRHLDRRLSADAGGTYSERLQGRTGDRPGESLLDTLRRLHRDEGEDGLRRFHRSTCTWGPEKKVLRNVDALRQANLWIDCKRAAVFGGGHRLRDPAHDPVTGQFGVTADWQGLTLRLAPDDTIEECRIARDEPLYPDLLALLAGAVARRVVAFADLCPGAGVVPMFIARQAAGGSAILIAGPDRDRVGRCLSNAAANGLRGFGTFPDASALPNALAAASEACRPDLTILRLAPDHADDTDALAELAARADLIVLHPERSRASLRAIARRLSATGASVVFQSPDATVMSLPRAPGPRIAPTLTATA